MLLSQPLYKPLFKKGFRFVLPKIEQLRTFENNPHHWLLTFFFVFFSPDLSVKTSISSKNVDTLFMIFCTVILQPKGSLRAHYHLSNAILILSTRTGNLIPRQYKAKIVANTKLNSQIFVSSTSRY